MCRNGAKLFTPQNGLALIAGVAEIERVLHFRNVLCDKLRISPITVTGKDDPFRGYGFACAIGPLAPGTDGLALTGNDKIGNAGFGHDHGFGRRNSLFKAGNQPLPGHLLHGMHTVMAVPRVEKVIQNMEGNFMDLGKPVDRPRNLRHDGADMVRIGTVLVLCHDVSEERILAVGNGLCGLRRGSRGRDQPR